MNQTVATNIISMLSVEPLYYRNFGFWWWFIKRELKRLGHTQDELMHLGDFHDPAVDPYYEGLDPVEMVSEALVFQHEHRFDKRDNPRSFLPDGEPYEIFDEDAE